MFVLASFSMSITDNWDVTEVAEQEGKDGQERKYKGLRRVGGEGGRVDVCASEVTARHGEPLVEWHGWDDGGLLDAGDM